MKPFITKFTRLLIFLFFCISLLACRKEKLHVSSRVIQAVIDQGNIFEVNAVSKSNKGGYVIVGAKDLGSTSAKMEGSFYLLDIDGIRMHKWFTSTTNHTFSIRDVVPANEKGYLICGFTTRLGATSQDFKYLQFINENATLTTRISVNDSTGRALCAYAHPDGSFFVGGYTGSPTNSKIFLQQINKDGRAVWANSNPLGRNGRCCAIFKNPIQNDEIIVFFTDGSDGNKLKIAHLNASNGESVAGKEKNTGVVFTDLDFKSKPFLVSIQGDYYFAKGSTVYKYNQTSAQMLSKVIVGYDIKALDIAHDGELVMSAERNRDVYLYKFKSGFELDWEKSFGGRGLEKVFDLLATSDNGFIWVGLEGTESETNPFPGDVGVYVVKTGQWGFAPELTFQ